MSKDLLKKYASAIKSLEDRIKFFKKTGPHKGHLINLKDFKDLKKQVNYDKNKSNFFSTVDIIESEKKFDFKELEKISGRYLINMLLNGNEYIIVDTTFYKIISKNVGKNPKTIDYNYPNNLNELNITFEKNDIVKFNIKENNIINSSSLKKKTSESFKDIEKTFEIIKNYYNFEIALEKDMKSKTKGNKSYKGYLIEKEALDKWKEKIQYDEIKNKYLTKKNLDKEAKDKLIYLFEKNNLTFLNLIEIKNTELNIKQKVEDFIKTKSLALVSEDFISSLELSNKLKEIEYYIYDNTIEIIFDSNNTLSIKCKDNIIESNSNLGENNNNQNNNQNIGNNNDFANDILTILLNIFLEEKEFLDKVEDSKNNINNSPIDYCLINSSELSKMKNFFSYDDEIKKISDENQLKSISGINSVLLNKIKTKHKEFFDKISKQQQDFSNKFSSKILFYITSNKRTEYSYNYDYIYPNGFQIISKDSANKLMDILGNKDNAITLEEVSIGFNLGNVIMKPTKGTFAPKDKFYSYIYSLSKESNENLEFNTEVLISFDDKDSFNNNFKKLIEDNSIIDSCINNINNIKTKLNCKAMLLNKSTTKLNTKKGTLSEGNDLNNKEIEEKVDKYISYSIKLYIEYDKIKKQIEEKSYLINKNIIEEIQDILCFKEVNEVLIKNNELIKDYSGKKEQIEKIRKEIKSDTIIKTLKELNDDKIKELIKKKLEDKNNKELKKIQKDQSSFDIFYYDNCFLVNKDIIELYKDITKINEFDMIKKEVKSINNSGDIIIFIKDGSDEVINIANLDKGNDLKIKYIIKVSKFSNIFNNINSSGFSYINEKVSTDNIFEIQNGKIIKSKSKSLFSNDNKNIANNIKKPTNTAQTGNKNKEKNKNIYSSQRGSSKAPTISDNKNNGKDLEIKKNTGKSGSLNIKKGASSNTNSITKSETSNTKKNEISNDKNIAKEISEVKLDDKLKSLILLAINQKKDYSLSQSSFNKGYKVYLINNNLDSLKFGEINNELTFNSTKISTTISEINKSDLPTISSKIGEITSKLNQEKLKKLNDDIKNFSSPTLKWEPKTDNLNLLNSKNIKIFTEFIISPENTFKVLQKSFRITSNIKPVNYIHIISGGDIIFFDKIILYGKIDKNKFEIKYIFEFDTESDLNTEITEIKKGVETYIRTKSVFLDNNSKDIISPIFSSYKTIGNVYKYNSYDDFSKCIDYKKYIKNDKFSRFIALYNFYNDTQKKLNKNNNITEKYYLINENLIQEIKNKCNYDQLKQIFEEKNIKIEAGVLGGTPDEKKILKILKNIPKDILENNFSSNIQITKIKKTEINIITVQNKNDMNEYAFIYDNFGILDKTVAESFLEGISYPYAQTDKIDFDCTINDGRILVDYQKNLGNQKYVSIIGTVDPTDFIVFNEFALIYKDYSGFSSNNMKIKNKLNKYIQESYFVNGVCPITDYNCKELGNIIQIEQTSSKKTNIPKKPYSNNDIQNIPDRNITNPYKPPIKPFNPIPPKPLIDEYNLNSTKNVTSIRQYFQYPPLIGLENIGATCYMNATLQCFSNILKFVDYFKYNKHLINIVKNDYNKSKLSSSFKLLIENLWPDDYLTRNKKFYAPNEYKTKISTMNSLFEGVQANDSKDLVNFIIMTLHDELNKAGNNIANFSPTIMEQRNQQLMLNNFIQNFQKTNQSIISDLFYAMNCNMIQCSSCGSQSYNYQTYFFLVFPLEEVRKNKFSNFNQFNNFNNMFNNNEVNIYDCFEYDKKISFMTGQNAMHCNYCQKTCNSSMRTVLTTGPIILIIILNRGKGIEFNVKINFVEQLNLANYIQFGNTGVNYELIGVITHLGDSGMSGHFIAYCKSPISKTWYQYNDAMVNPVNNFKKDVIDFAMPYLLFYQKMN